MKKIVIVSGLPISANPRSKKEADVLSNAGYQVEVIGAIYDIDTGKTICNILKNVNWKYLPIVDLSKGSIFEYLKFLFSRIRLKFWTTIKKVFHLEVYMQLGYYPYEIYKCAKEKNADLYILHAEESLWAGCRLIRDGYKVAVDIEDWYSEDGLLEDREKRPVKIMEECESFLLKNSVFSLTTSNKLSQRLAETYQCRAPHVVYNSFPIENSRFLGEKKYDRQNLSVPSIIWFSRTIGPGRGLEEIIEALNFVHHPFEFHIRGLAREGYCSSLLEIAEEKIKARIFFHSQAQQSELLSRLQEHDIGYCGELSECLNHDLTISNKMMEYLSAGLAVVATNTSGQEEVSKMIPKGVFLFDQNSVSCLVQLLDKLLANSDLLANAKKESLAGFMLHYNWNSSASLLRRLVKSILPN